MCVASPMVSQHVKIGSLDFVVEGGGDTSWNWTLREDAGLSIFPTNATFLAFQHLNVKLTLHWIGS